MISFVFFFSIFLLAKQWQWSHIAEFHRIPSYILEIWNISEHDTVVRNLFLSWYMLDVVQKSIISILHTVYEVFVLWYGFYKISQNIYIFFHSSISTVHRCVCVCVCVTQFDVYHVYHMNRGDQCSNAHSMGIVIIIISLSSLFELNWI